MSISLGSASARLIVAECVKQDLLRNQCAYVLATAWHETGAFKYMRDGGLPPHRGDTRGARTSATW